MTNDPAALPQLTVRPDGPLAQSSPSRRFALVAIEMPHSSDRRIRAPVHVAFAIDRSGSMAGQKIALSRTAVRKSLDLLNSGDRFCIVAYDHEVRVVVPTTRADEDSKELAQAKLAIIEPRGRTDLGSGWLQACDQLAQHASEDSTARCFLLTDGLANVGIVDSDKLAEHAEQLYKRGLSTSTFGVGFDFDEELLQLLADNGGGNFYYIEHPQQILDLLTSELGETLEVAHRSVELRVQVSSGTDVVALTAHPVIKEGRTLRLRLGDLSYGQRLLLPFAFDRVGAMPLSLALHVRSAKEPIAGAELSWPSDPASDGRGQRDEAVLLEAAQAIANLARLAALGENREGNYEDAVAAIQEGLAGIRAIASDDPALAKVAAALELEVPMFRAPMGAEERKRQFFQTATISRSREQSGKSRKL